MNTTLVRKPVAQVPAQWLVLGVFQDDDEGRRNGEGPRKSTGGNESGPGARAEAVVELAGTGAEAVVERLRASGDLTGSLGELNVLHAPAGLSAESVLLVGLGPRKRFGAGAAFAAGTAASKKLASKPRGRVALVLPRTERQGDERAGHARPGERANAREIASALVEGAIVGTRGPGVRKSDPNRHEFEGLELVVPPDHPSSGAPGLDAALRRGAIVGAAVNLARDLANAPPSEKAPAALADRIQRVVESAGVGVECWDEHRLARERFGGLLGVAAGSAEPPRFLVLEHRGRENGPAIALVGKGVTFDSGGLCLKPPASMEDMKCDMTGAAVVAAVMLAAARLELPINVKGHLALTENMTGDRAMKMGDVLTIRDGTTVEVLNTDAEGRLILADALCYAAEPGPLHIVDLATLTGACVVALGTKVAGLFCNDDALADGLSAACLQTGERVWPMPLDGDYKELLKSHVADLKNVGGRWGGAVTAAKFLESFVGSSSWAHLDIAGPSWSDSESATRDVGATGCFVRALVCWLENLVGPSPA